MWDWMRLRSSSTSLSPRSRHHYMLTRLGFHFLFIAGFAMVGGALRGLNLLLVLAGVLVGAIFVQWRYSRAVICALRVQRQLPPEAIAGVPFRVRYRLVNRNWLTSAWMLRVEDRIGRMGTKRSRRGIRSDTLATCGVGKVAPASSATTYLDCVISERGRYRFGPLSVATTFPFSLLRSRSSWNRIEPFFVCPRLLQLRSGWQKHLLSRTDGVMPGAKQSGMADGEFFGLREWQNGDNPRWIHWRTTARIGDLAVRQFEQHRRYDLCVLVDGFDCGARGLRDSEPGQGAAETQREVELAISLAATLVVRLGAQPINRIALAVAAAKSDVCQAGRSAQSQREMLHLLAELEPCPTPKLPEVLAELVRQAGQAHDLIVVSPRSFEEASAAVNSSTATTDHLSLAQMLTPWRSKDRFRWLDVRQRDVTQWLAESTVATRTENFSEARVTR